MRTIDADELITLFPLGEFIRTECVRAIIYNMPTIEPQRMRGRWEYLDYGGVGNYHCTACRRICVNKGDYAFCPHCGAEMVERATPTKNGENDDA